MRKTQLFILFLSLLSAVLCFSRLPFLSFAADDFIWLYEASQQTCHSFFAPGNFDFVRPVSNLFWLIAWHLSGYSPTASHTLLLLGHLGVAVLLYIFACLILPSKTAPFWAAALFLSRAFTYETICLPAACGEMLVSLGLLTCLISYTKFRRTSRLMWLISACFSAIWAAWSKESAVCLLVALPLLEWGLAKFSSPKLRPNLTSLVVVSLCALAAFSVELRLLHPQYSAPWMPYRSLKLWAEYWHCALWQVLFIQNTHALSGAHPLAIGSSILIGLGGAIAAFYKKRLPLALIILWIPGSLIAYAFFVPSLAMACRYFYLASLGLSLAAAELLSAAESTRAAKCAALIIGTLLCLWGSINLHKAINDNFAPYFGSQKEFTAADQLEVKSWPLYVNEPLLTEPYRRYALACAFKRSLSDIQSWDSLMQKSTFPPQSTAIFVDDQTRSLLNFSSILAQNWLLMKTQHRLPSLPINWHSGREWPLISHSPQARGWRVVNGELKTDGTLNSLGNPTRLISPQFLVAPASIRLIRLKIELLSPKTPTEVTIAWSDNPAHFPAQLPHTYTTTLADNSDDYTSIYFSTEKRPDWFSNATIQQLAIIPSATPAKIRIDDIEMYGYPVRKPQNEQ